MPCPIESNQETHVVFSSDNRGILPLSVALFSVLDTSKNPQLLSITILSDGISDENCQKLQQINENYRAQLQIIDIRNLLERYELPKNNQWPVAAWGRIFIPDLLETRGNVVYLDIDTLVCTDIAELASIDLKDKVIGAVIESFDSERCPSIVKARAERPTEKIGYFNSGILLINVENFIRFQTIEKLLAFVNEYGDNLECYDQDALNEILFDQTLRLHPKWNWHDGFTRRLIKYNVNQDYWRGAKPKEAIEAALCPGVLHYQGPHKPWFYNYRIEGPRYKKVMEKAGLLHHGQLEGKHWKDVAKYWLYKPIYHMTWRKIHSLAKSLNIPVSY